MWRSVAIGVVLVGLLAGCSWGGGEAQARISRHVLEAKIRQVEGAAVRCSRHKAVGSRWACVVGDGLDPECHVVDVDNGGWSYEDRPAVCRFP